MSILTIYTRSFHPREDFRTGGLFFHGDNRGFSDDTKATARIHHLIEVDVKNATFGPAVCRSDPSSNPRLIKATGLNFHNNYERPETQPRHSETPKNITPYRPDGNQSVNIRIVYAGKNFAFPTDEAGVVTQEIGDVQEAVGMQRDFSSQTPHNILGGEVSDGKSNYTEPSSVFPYEFQSPVTYDKENGIGARSAILKHTDERWSGMVPDLDVMNNVSLRINRDLKRVDVSCTITGDGFPNCESFIIDGSSKVLFLASHVRTGTAVAQLPGNRQIPMNNTSLDADWQPDDSFGAQVNVRVAVDFTGAGAANDLGTGSKTREDWNASHTKRSPYGSYSQRVRDHIPLPQNQWVDDKINNNPEIVDYARKGRAAVGNWLDDASEWWAGED
ncbi:hypothetical protein GOZ81_16380 [Agrobacterium vitis]|uniref:hypothetical protein n=1 Tax=Agrobacterium vitis TaxID=373 RepID=UPI0012E75414|nr:hypothetical protein [Agrobacterium vitis]MVA72652.1 hypothetical protein [Agrobacterium vitis]